ncbi:MAG: phosphoenolpyruvate--protein phosphotransferase [Spirochaetota bacterium]|nr:phosphoenolpyruvate--protein phosphotransferase [Spirochaetota bacterium]
MHTKITGITASPGLRIGKAYIYKGTNIIIPKYIIADDQVDEEISRFEKAIQKTRDDIESIQLQIANNLSKDMADIFASHLFVLEDPLIDEKAKEKVRSEKRNIEWVLNDITQEIIMGISSINDEYLKERMIDISDINKRLINNLQENEITDLSSLDQEVIIFARDLTPSDTAMMNKNKILAFITDKGGRTSHTAIMARALEIPAIVGTIKGTSLVNDGDLVIVDALHGVVTINPSQKEIKQYTKDLANLKLQEIDYAKAVHLPSVTLDDEEISILGNIEMPEEMKIIKDHGANGIGLYRSEFLFLEKSLPDEEKQFNKYKEVVEFFSPLPVTIRTLDVGGDKIFSYANSYKESNPFLGCRAIRFSLQNIDLFITQLRAILRASAYGNVKLMFPMISTVEEIINSKNIVKEVMSDLKREGTPFNENIPIGIMIEVPSAVINADILADYSDFFSVGTNDLVQYTMAVDRINEKIAFLYNPLNLSVLRFLKQIVDISKKHSVPISICGEIAGEPKYTMILMGLGFRDFSMGTAFIYHIKRIIRSVTITECEELVNEILNMKTTNDIEKRLMTELNERFPKVDFN